MAELALAASIIQLADIGAKLSLNLFGLADSVRSAASEARMVATETSLFSHALRSLGKVIEKRLRSDKALRRTARRLLKSCKVVIAELSSLLSDMEAEASGLGGMVNGFKWTFKKARLNFLRSSLESLKSTMLLFVATIDLANAGESDSPNDDIPPLQDHVETMMRVTEVATAGLIEAARKGHSTDESTEKKQLTNGITESKSVVTEAESSVLVEHSNNLTSALIAQADGETVPQVGQLVLRSTPSIIPFGNTSLNLEAQQEVYRLASDTLTLYVQDDGEFGSSASRPEISGSAKSTGTAHDQRSRPSSNRNIKHGSKMDPGYGSHTNGPHRSANPGNKRKSHTSTEDATLELPQDSEQRPNNYREKRTHSAKQSDEGKGREGPSRAFRSTARIRHASTNQFIEFVGADDSTHDLPWNEMSTWEVS